MAIRTPAPLDRESYVEVSNNSTLSSLFCSIAEDLLSKLSLKAFLGPVCMRRAGPLASWLANNPALVYTRYWTMSQVRDCPALAATCLLKSLCNWKNEDILYGALKSTNKRICKRHALGAKYVTAHASQAVLSVSSVYMRVCPFEAGSWHSMTEIRAKQANLAFL